MENVFEMDYDIERILSALKYFYENAQEYAIVAAGSLLGIALHEGTSFPVGKVDFLTLYPLNFTEFLLAAEQEQLVELAEKKDYELINAFADKYTDLLRKYYYVGGMPEVVSAYLETDDLQEVRSIQQQLLLYYANDFSKHAPKETVPRIQMVWNSIPMQLSKENRKFIYGMVREGGRAKDFELAIQWLLDCGLIHKSYRIRKPDMPLISYMDMPSFKIYMSDVGLLGARCNLDAITLLEGNEIFKEFKGALTEQFVAQELVSSGIELYYYSADNSSGEVDFVLQRGNKVIPVEVKAEENLQAKSLRALCKKYELSDAVRSSMSNYREQEWMVNVPLYLLRMYMQ